MKARIPVAAMLVALAAIPLSRTAEARQDPQGHNRELARRADLYCTGTISDVAPRAELQVVGGEKESIRNSFAQGDIVFLDKGRNGGVNAGAVYYILRPLGEVKHPFGNKKLGHLVRELGMLRVIEVQDRTSTAEIMVSCDMVELGDVLKPYEAYTSPGPPEHKPLPRYGEGSGGMNGRIVMARNFHEFLAANEIVYIDLGSRQGVKQGDSFTIYRKVGRSEGIVRPPDDNIVQQRSRGFESDRYRGGTFSTSATRVSGRTVVRNRPQLPRKVVGEIVVLRVEKDTAVALITRTTEEVNVGDHIERVY